MRFNILRPFLLCLTFLGFASTPIHAIDIQVVTSPGGIKAWLVESHQNPIISMKFAFTGGTAHEPEDKRGLANLLASTMDEGAGEYDSEAFRKVLTDESISLSFSAGREYTLGTFRTLTDSADLAFDLLKLSLSEPRFDQEPVDRIRRQIQAGIKSREKRPGTKSGEVFREMIYGDHPYARNSDGSIESLNGISADDLRAFKQKHFSREGLLVAVVGDISPEQLVKRLDTVFAPLAQAEQTDTIAPVANNSVGEQRVLEFDQPQTTIILVQDAIRRDDPDYFAAYVVNHIFGGGSFSSRLYQEVREKRGLTYGVGSSLGGDLKSPLLYAQLQTQNQTAKQALDLVLSEWQRMAEQGPTQEEMDSAIDYLIGSYAMQFTNTASIADVLLGLQIGEREPSYINDRVDIFRSLTLEDLKRAAKRVWKADTLTKIITGKPEGL